MKLEAVEDADNFQGRKLTAPGSTDPAEMRTAYRK